MKCNHIWIPIVTYSHPFKIGRQVVVKRCLICKKEEIKTQLFFINMISLKSMRIDKQINIENRTTDKVYSFKKY
ncbi:MAG: hypothetical protein RR325_03590 [Bacilli bacterium]